MATIPFSEIEGREVRDKVTGERFLVSDGRLIPMAVTGAPRIQDEPPAELPVSEIRAGVTNAFVPRSNDVLPSPGLSLLRYGRLGAPVAPTETATPTGTPSLLRYTQQPVANMFAPHGPAPERTPAYEGSSFEHAYGAPVFGGTYAPPINRNMFAREDTGRPRESTAEYLARSPLIAPVVEGAGNLWRYGTTQAGRAAEAARDLGEQVGSNVIEAGRTARDTLGPIWGEGMRRVEEGGREMGRTLRGIGSTAAEGASRMGGEVAERILPPRKPLTDEEAAWYLRNAGGDPVQARADAEADGFEWIPQ